MNGFNLVFGTTVDSAGSIVPEVVQVEGSTIILDISAGYTGGALYYFEDSSAGMGYVTSSSTYLTFTNTDVLQLMDDETYTLTGNPNAFANGTYALTASSGETQGHGESLYNVLKVDGIDWDWHTENVYNNSGTYTGTNSKAGYQGEWLQITMPYAMKLTSMSLKGRENRPYRRPYKASILGSNNGGTSYDLIAEKTNVSTHTDLVTVTTFTGVTTAYSTFAMVVHETIEGTNSLGTTLTSINIQQWDLTGDANTVLKYSITVSGDPAVFYIDETPQPNLTFTAGKTYVFDQSDPLNTGNQLVLGTVPDLSSSMISYQTVVGTPGQPGAYTSFTASEETVYYFSYETPDMGFVPIP